MPSPESLAEAMRGKEAMAPNCKVKEASVALNALTRLQP